MNTGLSGDCPSGALSSQRSGGGDSKRRSYAAMKNCLSKALALGCFIFFLPPSGLAQDSEAQKKTLAGLKGFFVVISDLGQDAHAAGITELSLANQAESGLRSA